MQGVAQATSRRPPRSPPKWSHHPPASRNTSGYSPTIIRKLTSITEVCLLLYVFRVSRRFARGDRTDAQTGQMLRLGRCSDWGCRLRPDSFLAGPGPDYHDCVPLHAQRPRPTQRRAAENYHDCARLHTISLSLSPPRSEQGFFSFV